MNQGYYLFLTFLIWHLERRRVSQNSSSSASVWVVSHCLANDSIVVRCETEMAPEMGSVK